MIVEPVNATAIEWPVENTMLFAKPTRFIAIPVYFPNECFLIRSAIA